MDACNRDCFHCIHDDCICDSISLDESKELTQIDRELRQTNQDDAKERKRKESLERYYANREKILAYQKTYREKNREKNRLAYKKWYKANRDKALEYQRIYYEENRDKILEYGKARYKAQKERAKAETRTERRAIQE